MSTPPTDRDEILDLIGRYAFAIDDRDWDALDDLFTPDGRVDFTATGGVAGTIPELKAFLDEAFSSIESSQHLMGSTVVSLAPDGRSATARTMCLNPLVFAGGTLATFAISYEDRLVRTPDGWRFAERVQRQAHAHVHRDATPFRLP